MAEGGRGDAPREGPPGAPPDAVSIAEARRRWIRFRAEVWLTLAEVRGQRGRVALLRRLRPGSPAFRVVTGVAGPLLALRRRLRASGNAPTTARSFPLGAEPPASVPRLEAAVNDVATLVIDGDDPTSAIARANDLVAGDGWLLVLDAGDRLLAGALNLMAFTGARYDAHVVFGDQRTLDPSGSVTAVARPRSAGWVSLLSYDATGRALLFSRAALRGVGGFDPAAGWAFRHDAVVRLVEAGATVGSVAEAVVVAAPEDPRYAAALPGVTAAALRRCAGGGRAELDDVTPGLVRWRVDPPSSWPRVSIVIPTRDRLDLLAPCLAELETRTTYPDYEVVIVDNDSRESATKRFFTETRHRVVAAPGEFNYARVINRGVAASTGDVVVTLNNDVTITTDDWLEQMVGVASLPGVGIVGVYLEDPAGHSLHEGVAIAPYPQHLRRDRNYVVPDAFLGATREVSAVTGACQMVRRSLFEELGGLDETLAVVHNDTDFCLRAQRLGHRVVYVASVRLVHAESSSRGRLTPPADIERFIARWDVFGSLGDPWFPARWELIGDVIRWRRRGEGADREAGSAARA
ncbi:MAG: glycosyltransferase [Acidimicrobiales bacterium]